MRNPVTGWRFNFGLEIVGHSSFFEQWTHDVLSRGHGVCVIWWLGALVGVSA